jgi:hypothetical protein
MRFTSTRREWMKSNLPASTASGGSIDTRTSRFAERA